MKVLKPTTDQQTIKVIPRSYDSTLTVSFRDDQTNVTTDYTITYEQEGDYLVYTGVFSLKEGHYYDFKTKYNNFYQWQNADVQFQEAELNWNEAIKDTPDNIVEKVFCTDQEINQNENEEYTINKNVYLSDDTYNKEYIIYEG